MGLNRMNDKVIFTFFFFLAFLCKTQTSKYHPFPEGTGVWKHEFTEMCDPHTTNFSCKSGYQYIQKGDTIISSKHYTKLNKEGWRSSCSQFPPYYCTDPVFYGGYYGATRNDTVAKTVLYVDAGETTEVILFDFGVKKGDTLKSYSCKGLITSIDSALVGGSYHKRFITSNGFNIIEGIGTVGFSNYDLGDM